MANWAWQALPFSDHPELKDFLRYIIGHGGGRNFGHGKVGISSLRAERIDRELVDLLVAGGVGSVALGCEAASEKLRFQTGKKLSDRRLFEAVENLASGGMRNIRLYFMVGLPRESEADCLEIVELVKKLRENAQNHASRSGGLIKMTVSLNLFIPKAGTPWERLGVLDLKAAKQRMALVGGALVKERGITVLNEPPRAALVQALLSQGDSSVGELLWAAHQNGGNWQQVMREHRQQVDFIVYRPKPPTEVLPWSFIRANSPA